MFERAIAAPRFPDWGRPHFHDFGLSLIILDDAAGAAEIVAHEVRDQLHEGLPIVQDFRLEGIGQNGVGKHQHQNGRNPACQQDRDDDV